jgi:hypothetical protein
MCRRRRRYERLLHDGQPNQTYNVCSGEARTCARSFGDGPVSAPAAPPCGRTLVADENSWRSSGATTPSCGASWVGSPPTPPTARYKNSSAVTTASPFRPRPCPWQYRPGGCGGIRAGNKSPPVDLVPCRGYISPFPPRPFAIFYFLFLPPECLGSPVPSGYTLGLRVGPPRFGAGTRCCC